MSTTTIIMLPVKVKCVCVIANFVYVHRRLRRREHHLFKCKSAPCALVLAPSKEGRVCIPFRVFFFTRILFFDLRCSAWCSSPMLSVHSASCSSCFVFITLQFSLRYSPFRTCAIEVGIGRWKSCCLNRVASDTDSLKGA